MTRRFALFSTRVSFSLADDTALELSDTMMGFDFAFTVEGAVAARVTRAWAGPSRGVLGHSRHVLSTDPTVSPPLRLALIGGCIVLDLIRRRKNNG